MELKPEITITGLFIIFLILLFGYEMSGSDLMFTLFILFILIVVLIYLILLIKAIIQTPKDELVNNFKNQHIITKILTVITLISVAYELITLQMISWSSIPFLLLMISQFCEWLIKKEE